MQEKALRSKRHLTQAASARHRECAAERRSPSRLSEGVVSLRICRGPSKGQ